MDEDIAIINEKTRNEKIKNFFVEKKKLLITLITILILIILGFYTYKIFKDNHKQQLSDKYHKSVIQFKKDNSSEIIISMKEVIMDRDTTFSPLALYFLIDNNLVESKEEINELFNIVIDEVSLETEIQNLIIYKKALYNADKAKEIELLDILNPLINSKSIWKSHALYLMAELYYSKGEKQKSKEFFSEILNLENGNQNLKLEAQKRLNRDLGD